MPRKLEVVIEAVTKGLESNLKSAEGRFQRTSHAAGVAGLALAGGLAVGLEKSVHAAVDAQASQARLATAFKNAGLSASRYEPQVKMLEASSRKLGFTEEDVHKGLGSLITATGNYGKAAKDLSVAQDIARFKGVSLTDATKMLTMAMTGSQRAVKQLGINVSPVTLTLDELKKSVEANITASHKGATAVQDHKMALDFFKTSLGITELAQAKLTDKQLTGDAVIKATSEHLHGQAVAYADTAAGGMAQFKAQLNFLEITMGTALIPVLTKVAETLASLTAFFSAHAKETKLLIIAIGSLAAILLTASAAMKVMAAASAVARAATLAWTAAQWLLNVALSANPIGIVVVAVAGLVAALVVLQVKYHAVTNAVDFLHDHLYLLMAVPVIGWTVGVAAALIANWGRIKDGVGAATSAVVGSIMGVVHVIQTLVSWVMAAVHAVDALIGALGRIHVPSIHIPHIGVPHIPGLATGVQNFGGGLALVGEKGPELVSLPGGSSVTPNNQIGGKQIIQLILDGTVLAEALIDPMRNQAQLIKQRTGKPAFS